MHSKSQFKLTLILAIIVYYRGPQSDLSLFEVKNLKFLLFSLTAKDSMVTCAGDWGKGVVPPCHPLHSSLPVQASFSFQLCLQ